MRSVSECMSRLTFWSHRYNQTRQNKSEHGQLQIFYSAGATTKRIENQSNQVCMVEEMQRLY
jgi:hypothetical protein